MRKRYETVIYDLDGTLLNTLEDLANAVNHAMRESGYPERTSEEVCRFVGNGVHKLCERCLPPDTPAAEVETFFAEFNDYYSRHCLDKTAPYDGIPAVLAQLKAAGVHLAVASNKTQPFVETIVRHYFGSDCFDQIFGSSDDRPKKPAPAIVEQILKTAGVSKAQAVMIGDSDVDIQTGKNAGVHTIGCVWGFRGEQELERAGADDLARTPADLLRFMEI